MPVKTVGERKGSAKRFASSSKSLSLEKRTVRDFVTFYVYTKEGKRKREKRERERGHARNVDHLEEWYIEKE